MIGFAFLSLVLGWLIVSAWALYPLARREVMRERRMHAAETDDHQCDLCERVSRVRELVLLHDDVALCCAACAGILKATKRQEAA